MATEEKIIKEYIEFESLNGRPPHSVLELAKNLKISEATFYKVFPSVEVLRQHVALKAIEKTLERLNADEQYPKFTAREKLLSLYFTLFEELKNNRSYYVAKYSNAKETIKSKKDWDLFMDKMDVRIDEIIDEARQNEEIKDRPFIGDHFSKGFKLVFAYLFRVWIKDESVDFSISDAAIEKTVNASFDMLGESPLDSLIDFGKFAFNTKVM